MNATTTPPVTTTQVKAAVNLVFTVAEALRESGSVPSGHLYAAMMSVVDMNGFENILGILKRAGIVRQSGDMLHWVDPRSLQ